MLPQQAMVPSVLTPHANSIPALTDVNVPSGGLAPPSLTLPQQAMVPSALTPHPNPPPMVMEVNVPAGGVA